MEIALVLSILVVAFILFAWGALQPDLIASLVLVVLVLTRVVEPSEAFSGFSSFAVITIAGLMVIGEGLKKTGVVKFVAKKLEGVINEKEGRLLFLNTAIPGLLSGFVNIVASAAFFIPIILRLCKQLKMPHSQVLLPMASAALVGANLTLIGASHNLVVNSLLDEATGSSFAFFDFTIVGIVLLTVVLLYIFLFARKLLPGKEKSKDPINVPNSANLINVYELQDRLFEVWVGKEIKKEKSEELTQDFNDKGLILVAIVRASEELIMPKLQEDLQKGDMLLFQGQEEKVEQFAEDHDGLAFVGAPEAQKEYPISTGELAEAVIPPRSPAIGKSVAELGLEKDFGMTVIAYYREGKPHRTAVNDIKLQEGDSILIYGPREKLREFDPEKELLIYYKPGAPEVVAKLKKKAPLAAAILALVIIPSAIGVMPIAATAIAGAVVTILFGLVDIKKVYQVIDWKTLVLIGAMYPLGVALNETGAAQLISDGLIKVLGDFGPLAVFGGVVLLTMILTQPIHNAAVAIIMAPIAINSAQIMNSDPKGFCVGVIVACSTTFLMPIGHPAPYLVQEPGNYKPVDYLRFGLGLNILAFAVILTVVPYLWPL